ncbi:MAG TPA: hypothetical protein EYQ20_02995 [candidate division Zixibacteria bacterium]|nr:hypothetical protein [candidate division Zixibacteria bacterium]
MRNTCHSKDARALRQEKSLSVECKRIASPLLFCLLMVLSALSCSESNGPEKYIVTTQALSGASWPLFIGVEGGYFDKYGLDVDLRFGRHPAGIAGVSSGDVLTINIGLDTGLAAASKGKRLVMVGSPVNVGTFVLMGTKETQDVKELADKRIAIGRVGDPPYHYTLALFKHLGIRTDNIKWIPSGGAPTRMVTMINGAADAALLTAPTYYKLIEEGYPVLVNMSDYPEVIIAQAYMFHRDMLENKPDVVENFMKAVIDATHRFYTDKPFAMEAMRQHTNVKDDVTLSQVYDDYFAIEQLERIPYIRQDAIESVVERNSERLPELKDMDFSDMLFSSVLDKLAEEGFFEEIYGPDIKKELKEAQAAAAR